MQIMAYFLLAEVKLFLQEASGPMEATDLLQQGLLQARQVPVDVFHALSKAWPVDIALERFRSTSEQLDTLMQTRKDAASAYSVHVVVCRCQENLDWLKDILDLALAGATVTLFSYSTCGQAWTHGPPVSTPQGVTVVSRTSTRNGPDMNSECSAQDVLTHVIDVATAAPTFTAFLSAADLLDDSEHRLLAMVFKSLGSRTFNLAGFLPLGMARAAPNAPSACELAVWQKQLRMELPHGYRGTRFVVSGSRLQRIPVDHYRSLLELVRSPPAICSSGSQMDLIISRAWHILFGEDARLPTRADNAELPLFLRFADGPSGFKSTRLPKTSAYLASQLGSLVYTHNNA